MNLEKRLRNYFSFSGKEIQSLLLLALAVGFMISFKDWGTTTFNAAEGIRNLFDAFLISAIAAFVHESMHKIAAAYKGYAAEHKPWWAGVAFGLMLTFVTQGNLFFFGSSVLVYHLAAERLGQYKYGFRIKDVAFVSVAGALANLALAAIFKLVFVANSSPLAEKAFMINIWFAVFNILPLPWLDGGAVFFGGRTIYSFFLALIVAASVSLYFSHSVLNSIIFSVVVGVILAATWAILVEGVVDTK
jgi:Zn-dependent protease